MELGLHNRASVTVPTANDEHSEYRDLSPPAHDILKEITKVEMKEVLEEAFGFPEAGDGKAEKLLASAEFPGDH
jgi:hypothetical protein